MNTYKYITCAFAAFMLSGCEGQLDITNPNQPGKRKLISKKQSLLVILLSKTGMEVTMEPVA